MAVSVTSKGQVTIPKRVRDALGVTPGSKVEFDVSGGGATQTGQEACFFTHRRGAAILDYKGPRVSVVEMHRGLAMKKASKRARRDTNILARFYLRDDAVQGLEVGRGDVAAMNDQVHGQSTRKAMTTDKHG